MNVAQIKEEFSKQGVEWKPGPPPDNSVFGGFYREVRRAYDNVKSALDFKSITAHGVADVATLGLYGSARNLAGKPVEKWSLDDIDPVARTVKGVTGYDIARDPYYRAGRDVAITVGSAGIGKGVLAGTAVYQAYEKGKEYYEKVKEIKDKAEGYGRDDYQNSGPVYNGNNSSSLGAVAWLPERETKMNSSLQNLVSQGQNLLTAVDQTTNTGKTRSLDPTSYVVEGAQNVIDGQGWNWLIYAVVGYMAYKALT